jgi:sugar O-acyltransferase (sialic acid O-acetyltransferase NeuD family)
MTRVLFIYGAGGLGREVLALCKTLGHWDDICFVDDSIPTGEVVNGHRIAGNFNLLQSFNKPTDLVVAIGDPAVKARLVRRISNPNIRFPIVKHNSAIILDPASITVGPGTIIAAGSVLTTNIRCGSHVLINLNVTIGHDSNIGDYTSIMPGVNIAGDVTIAQKVLIGSGASVRNRVRLQSGCTVGMGAVVLTDVLPGTTVAGIPAKLLRR